MKTTKKTKTVTPMTIEMTSNDYKVTGFVSVPLNTKTPTIPTMPSFTEAEEALNGIKKIEIVASPNSLPDSFRKMVTAFIKKKKQSIFIKSSPYFMATIMYECKMNNIQCRAYKN